MIWPFQRRQRGSIGAQGEDLAARYLKKKGYRIEYRNLVVGRDEADIVAWNPQADTLVIVEVKTRKGIEASPALRIDRAKQHNLSRLASQLQKRAAYQACGFRFDVVLVNLDASGKPILQHLEHAFESTL